MSSLCCFFFSQTVSSGLGKSSYLPAAWGYKKLQLPVANTTWLQQVPLALGAEKGQEAMEPIWILWENSSAWPLLSQPRLSCNESHRKPQSPTSLAKNLLKSTPIPRQGVFIPSLRKSGQLDLESMKMKTEYTFCISKQPSGILFFFQQGDSKLAGLSKLQFPCPQPSLKKNVLVSLACVEVLVCKWETFNK